MTIQDNVGHNLAKSKLNRRCSALLRSVPIRALIVALQLSAFYILSQKDAAFFYQQF